MKVSTQYKVVAGLVRLSEQESIPLPEFREKLAGLGTISQPAWGWIEVTMDVADDLEMDEKRSAIRPHRLEFK